MNIYTSEVEYLRQRVEELETLNNQLQGLLRSLGYVVERITTGLRATPIKEQP